MSTGVGKHKMLALGPTEPWSIREKLCLASSVMRSGDQNWVSVSRAIKPFSEPGRPPDWFSQKHCASQYSELLETTEAPKRKRGEKGEVVETIEDVIVRRLTAERIDELKRLLKDTQEKYRKLKKEVDLIQAGHMDSKLEELWGEIEQKKKQEEEEAEQKRRATESAYQARQAAKNTKRHPSITVRSPLGSGSPSMDLPQPDTPQPMIDESCPSPMAQGVPVFMPVSESTGPVHKEGSLGALIDESPQKKLPNQKATPPPSPLLSELLKKGSLLSTSPRLVVEGEMAAALSNGAHGVDIHVPAAVHSTSHDASTDAPTLSRLLEGAPPVQMPASAEPSNPPAVAPPASGHHFISSTGAAVAECSGPESVLAVQSGSEQTEGREGELVEDLVAVSYMEDELDLETVGDIIAIIEEKVDDSVEVLDAAAVEAALSLCEEAVAGGHSLSDPWESQPFKPPEPESRVFTGPQLSSPAPSPVPTAIVVESVMVEEVGPTGASETPTEASDSAPPPVPGNVKSEPETAGDEERDREEDGPREEEEEQTENRTPSPSVKCESEEWTQPEAETPCLDSEDSSASGRDPKEVKDEDGGSEVDADEGMEMKECGEGPYLSEVDPPASESEDGYGTNSQRYTTADSTASSPASSQFSMCSEDQEALQAQKIWKKAIMLVWRAAANHRYASVFLQPVSDDIAPGYHSIVHRPMDLSAIKKNIETGQIRTTAEFQRDIMLMFQNAVMYNSSDHDVYHMALEMQRDVLEQIQQFLATQLIMQTSESGISAKSLRGREANRKQDPNDKSLSPAHKDAHLEPEPAAMPRRKRNNSKQDTNKQDGGTRGRRSAIEADMKMKK
ncbi:bromodomain-containing protein 8 isoform X3 [Ictalurus furcatus]|uniref:bromodomain-containing protein 8 isoform X3 n=1 Tax=Ictalurus furcatus TaxID=66913 RepID=UPI00234FECA5|nr:bromodomain-containing protein 8 isoform X3 [Ictalurus furcatus]